MGNKTEVSWHSQTMGSEPDTCTVCLANEFASSSALYPLWQGGDLCDVELITSDGAVVPAHKVVLASASPMLKALMCSTGLSMRERALLTQGRLELSGVDGASLRLLLHAVYSQSLQLGGHNVERLLAGAGYLGVEPVLRACCAYLERHLCLSTCVDTLLLASRHDCDRLFERALRYLEGHFPELLQSEGEDAQQLQRLPHPLLLRVLSSDSLSTPTELDVARAVALWLAADPGGRAEEQLESLLGAVRLHPAQLLHQMEGDAIWGQLPVGAALATKRAFLQACTAGLEGQLRAAKPGAEAGGGGEAATAAGLGLGRGLGGFPPRHATPTRLLVAGGVDEGWRSLKTVEVYDPSRDAWSQGPALPSACSFPSGATVGEAAFLVEGAAHTGAVVALGRQKWVWAQRPRLATPRVNMAAAGLPGMLVVMGGRAGISKDSHALQSAECLSLSEGRWLPLPPMASPRAALGAAALNGAIWAVGGQSDRATHTSAEWFDPGREAWVQLAAPMHTARKYLAVGAVGGRLYAVGGMTHARRRLAGIEALDPREGRWQVLPAEMSAPRSSLGVGVLGEELFVVGGSVTADSQSHGGVECFCPRAGCFRRCAPISHGRSGLAVLPI